MGDGEREQELAEKLLRQSLTAKEKQMVADFERTGQFEPASPVDVEKQEKQPKRQNSKRVHTAAELVRNTISHQNRNQKQQSP